MLVLVRTLHMQIKLFQGRREKISDVEVVENFLVFLAVVALLQ
jgi:hypothetical protein